MSKSIEAFLAPLAKLAVRHPDVEAAVIWGDASGWDAQDDDLEMLDAEEITFYAEGLLAEGFSMTWQVVAAAHTPTDPDLVLLFFWQGSAPALPVSSDAALVRDSGTWTADQFKNSTRIKTMPNAPFSDLHARCTALGTRLFTITVQDPAHDLARRAYTSHPIEYPTSGTKPLTRDGWYDHVIVGHRTYVANTPPEFAKYFFDHALIISLGLGSCINIPVIAGTEVLGTVNLLAEAGHFTPTRLEAYLGLVTECGDALRAEMTTP